MPDTNLEGQNNTLGNNGGTKSNLTRAQSRSNHNLGGSKLNLASGGASSDPHNALGNSDGVNGSMADMGEQQLYENTFKTKPDKKFSGGILQKSLEKLLETSLQSTVYSPELCAELTKKLSAQVIQEVNKIGYPRYKFVTEVVIGEMKGQGIKVMSRCLWDTKTDSYVSAFYKNASLVIAHINPV